MKNYLNLMKLRVVELLLVTTVPALFIASSGIPSISTTFWSLLGGTLAAGGANAFNMVIEDEYYKEVGVAPDVDNDEESDSTVDVDNIAAQALEMRNRSTEDSE
jgi:hypothetical protein